MKRFVLLVIVMVFAILAVPATAATNGHGPKMVVMPVQVESEFPAIRQELEYLSFKALKEMNFDIITGDKVVDAIKKCGFSLKNYSGSERGTKRVLSDENSAKTVSDTVLQKDALVEVGKYFKADYAVGVMFKCKNKMTTQIRTGRINNGRVTAYLMVVDVKNDDVLYDGETKEIGDADKNSLNAPLGIGGLLAATGVIGKGKATRTAGWLAMATPQFVKAGDKNGETLQYNAGLKAAQMIFGDFQDRWENRDQ